MTSPAASVLVVCRANVCRSQLAAWYLHRALADAAGAGSIEVSSRGTHAGTPHEPCPRIADGRDITGPSAALTDEDVQRAGLILTADRACRGDVVTRSPDAADRIFTLREAAALVDGVDPRSVAAARDLTALVRVLGTGRGRVPTFGEETIVLARRGLRRRSVEVHVQDIPDGHSEIAGLHEVIETLTPPAVRSVAAALESIAAAPHER